jgi:putative transcriptional regulator
MSALPTDLETPVLLAAMPQILDPFFDHSVVLLIDHQPEGSFGLIVNRPTELSVDEVLQGLEIDWKGNPLAMTHFGGPVQPQLGTVLYSRPRAALENPEETTLEICPGVHITQHIGDLSTIATHPPGAFRLLLGYAGWGGGQLEQEIERNDWLIAPLEVEMLFTDDTDGLLERVLSSLGIDPGTLPSWTQESDPEQAN